MKKFRLLLIVLLAGFYINTQAQEENIVEVKKQDDFKSFRLGIAVAPQINWIRPEESILERNGIRFTVNPSIYTDIQIWQNFYLTTGLGLSYQGGKLRFQTDEFVDIEGNPISGLQINPDKQRIYKTTYLEIPAKIKIITDDFGKWRFSGNFGVNLDMLISAKAEDKFENMSYTFPNTNVSFDDVNIVITKDIKDQTNFLNVMGVVGLGAEYQLSRIMCLTFGADYCQGFTNTLSNKHDAVNGEKPSSKNSYVQLNVGIVF